MCLGFSGSDDNMDTSGKNSNTKSSLWGPGPFLSLSRGPMDRVAHKCWLSSQPDRWTEGPAQVPGQGHLPRPRPPEAGSGWGDPGAGLQILSAGGPTDFRGSCLPARLVPGAHSKPESSSMAAPAPRRWTAEHPGLLQEPDGRALGRSRGRGPPGGRGRGRGPSGGETWRKNPVGDEPREVGAVAGPARARHSGVSSCSRECGGVWHDGCRDASLSSAGRRRARGL